MSDLVERVRAVLGGRTVLEVLGHSWSSKKRAAAQITNPLIDRIADTALQAGATG